MTRYINKTCRAGLALLALACLLMLLAPRALAADVIDKGDDAIQIGLDGTVTLLSGHAADEKLASVQFVLNVPAGSTFSFAPLGDRLTYSYTAAVQVEEDKTQDQIHIFVAGAEPLMGEGVTSLTVGTVSASDLQAVTLAEGSLRYVYGSKVITQSAGTRSEQPETPRAKLERLCQEAVLIEDLSPFTQESKDAFMQARNTAAALLENAEATDDALTAAYEALKAAMDGLALPTVTDPPTDPLASLKAQLRAALDEVEGEYDETKKDAYTTDSWNTLMSAISAGEALLAPDREQAPTEEELQTAINALAAAKTGLAPADKDALLEVIKKAEQLLEDAKKEGTYAQEDLDALQTALDNARTVYDKADATKDDWAEAIQSLRAAMDLTPVVTPDPVLPTPGGNVIEPTAGPAEPTAEPTDAPSPVPTTEPTSEPTATPAATSGAAVPDTGDGTVLAPWLALLCLCAGMLTVLAVRRGKANR